MHYLEPIPYLAPCPLPFPYNWQVIHCVMKAVPALGDDYLVDVVHRKFILIKVLNAFCHQLF
jgi:hypothetical protein